MSEKIFKLAIKKAYNPETREITGWAYRSDEIDRDNELILASCWSDPNTTKDLMRNPVLCACHSYTALPLGRILELRPTEKGLWFKAKFARTAAAREAAQFIMDTNLAAFSVGFLPIEKKTMSVAALKKMGINCGHRGDGVMITVYTKISLIEVSLVSIPSSPGSTALGAAYVGGLVKTKELKSVLDRWITVEKDEPDKVPAYVAQALEKAISNALSPEVLGDTLGKSLAKLREKVSDPEPEIIVDKTASELSDVELKMMVKKAFDRILAPGKLEKMIRDAIEISVDRIRGVVR